MKALCLLLALIVLIGTTSTTSQTIWPKPESFSSEANGEKVKVDPCEIDFSIQSAHQARVQKMINWYLSSVFHCVSTSTASSKVHVTITINDETLVLPTETIHERYTLSASTPHSWSLTADYYPGFMRGFETLTQLFTQS